MHVAPPLEHTIRFRHYSCPECQGALEQVREESTGTLTFECRVGHRYGARELLVGKELRLEQNLWASLTTMDELIVLLLQLQEECANDEERAYRRRVEGATALRGALEQIIAGNDPVQLESEASPQPDPNSRLGRGGR